MPVSPKPEDTLPLMTWRARPDMDCEHVNRAWRDFTGYSIEQALGEGWARALHPEDLARWLDTSVLAFDERTPFEIEYRRRRRDGEYRWVLERAAPVYSADGVFLGYAGGCIDIDEQKRERHSLARALERERRLRLATEESSRLRHGLTLSVLRELQPPTQAMAACAGQARAELPPGSEAARALEAIERKAGAQTRVLSSLLDLAGAEEPGQPLLSGVRVLIVGREGDALVKPLRAAGADVRTARSTADALRTLGAWRPDVVLSESNETFIRALRALPAEGGGCLRAAAITDHAGAAVAAGFDAKLAKPVEPVALLATVARLAA